MSVLWMPVDRIAKSSSSARQKRGAWERERGRGRSCRGEKLGSLDSRENRGEDGKGDGSLEGKKKRIKKQKKKKRKEKEISVLEKNSLVVAVPGNGRSQGGQGSPFRKTR